MLNFFVQNYKFSAIVNHNGNTYFVDACDTGDCRHELMVFKVNVHRNDVIEKSYDSRAVSILNDQEFEKSIDWSDLYVARASSKDEIEKVFDKVVSNIGAYLDSDDYDVIKEEANA